MFKKIKEAGYLSVYCKDCGKKCFTDAKEPFCIVCGSKNVKTVAKIETCSSKGMDKWYRMCIHNFGDPNEEFVTFEKIPTWWDKVIRWATIAVIFLMLTLGLGYMFYLYVYPFKGWWNS